jgi:hypothetical protein
VTALQGVLALAAILPASGGDVVIKSPQPAYELSLPVGYEPATPRETPPRYVRACGSETWTKISVTLIEGSKVLPQNLSGVTAEETLPCVPLPPDAKWSFSRLPWKGFDIGAVEYRAVVKDLPVIGVAVVLPLVSGSLTIIVSAPDPLEKECREDFREILSRVTKAPSPWHPPEYYQKIRTRELVGQAGVALLTLYPIAWLIFFRGHPMRAHWLRTGWLVAIAVLLFVPMTSPGETSLISNMLVNGIVPLLLLSFAARRVKMGLEMD